MVLRIIDCDPDRSCYRWLYTVFFDFCRMDWAGVLKARGCCSHDLRSGEVKFRLRRSYKKVGQLMPC